jgi:hypothetical protein
MDRMIHQYDQEDEIDEVWWYVIPARMERTRSVVSDLAAGDRSRSASGAVLRRDRAAPDRGFRALARRVSSGPGGRGSLPLHAVGIRPLPNELRQAYSWPDSPRPHARRGEVANG